jgi:signal transduction histidine kinase
MASGKFALERAACDLSKAIRVVADSCAQQAAKAGSDLQLDLEDGVRGHWDRFRLEQVLTNLIGNAIKYGAGGPIDIRLRTTEACAIIVVQDRGIGIPPDALDRIFGRFERSSGTENFSGLGLGLFITREIVEQHGGSIYAENREDGGARFVVELPLLKETESD